MQRLFKSFQTWKRPFHKRWTKNRFMIWFWQKKNGSSRTVTLIFPENKKVAAVKAKDTLLDGALSAEDVSLSEQCSLVAIEVYPLEILWPRCPSSCYDRNGCLLPWLKWESSGHFRCGSIPFKWTLILKRCGAIVPSAYKAHEFSE